MSKMVKYTEKVHKWGGKAIIRLDGQLSEIDLGTVTTDKKLKETGVKQLFSEKKDIAEGAIAIEVFKLEPVTTTYVLPVHEFKQIANVVEGDVEEEDEE